LNISSALIKQCVTVGDFETWSYLRKEYLPNEYHLIYEAIDNHCEKFHQFPSFDDLKLSIRHPATKDKVYALESVEVDIEPATLLEYLKNEYAQKEILNSLDKYIDNSVLFASADESVQELHQIVLDIEDKVDLEVPQESMQRIHLMEPEEELSKHIGLGLNTLYDEDITFSPRDLILVGGRRGSGKSITCANVANNIFQSGRSAIYFTIEMDSRAILQRCCSIATGVPFSRIRNGNLTNVEWEKVAGWQASRFLNGQERLIEYKNSTARDYNEFHKKLTTEHELLPTQQLDVIYDPSLTIAKIRAELDKKVDRIGASVIIVDYINQVKRSHLPSRGGQYDWTEQIEVSKALKSMAQEYECAVFSPYQTDATGEARFAKGILDAADAAYALETWDQEDKCITFNCVKMRSSSMKSFSSTMDWETLKIGPETALTPKERDESSHKSDEEIHDL